jgi:hypothetical protein
MPKKEFNKSKGAELQILCSKCKTETRHIVIQSTDINGCEYIDETFSIDWNTQHQIIECQGCLEISYREETCNSEDLDFRTNKPEVFVRIYPMRTCDTLFAKDFFNMPFDLKQIYEETIDCFNNQIFTLCAAGLRAIIEGICAEEGVKKGLVEVSDKTVKKATLEGKINGLYEKGILTKRQSEILHQHRYIGNEAIHKLITPSKEELELAIQIVEHILESVFEINHKALKLNKKREKNLEYNKRLLMEFETVKIISP